MDQNTIYGAATVCVEDIATGEVIDTLECLNLITDYGLSRLLSPIERYEQVANGISIGNKLDAVSETESTIPLSYLTKPTEETIITDDWFSSVTYGIAYRNKYAKATWSISVSGNDLVEGALVNHIYLTHTDSTGVKHPITTLKLRRDGADWVYTHNVNQRITITYQIFISITHGTVINAQRTFIENPENYTDLTKPYDFNAIRAFDLLTEDKSYVQTNNSGLSTIQATNGGMDVDGHWNQHYLIKWRTAARDTAVIRIGLLTLGLGTFINNNDYSLTLKVKRITGVNLTPRPVTSISHISDIPWNGFLGEASDSAKITAPPYQWVDIFYQDIFLRSVYINGTGEAIVDGRFTNEDLGWQSYPVFKSGNVLRFISRNISGNTAEVELQAPDKLAEDLVAIWFINPTTVRAVSKLNDRVDILWNTGFLSNNDYNQWVNSGAFGVCTTEFPEEPGYYYTDITVPERPNLTTSPYLYYQVTDVENNVYIDIASTGSHQMMLYNYVPTINYTTAKRRILRTRDIDAANYNTRYVDSYSGYNFLLSAVSGEIR